VIRAGVIAGDRTTAGDIGGEGVDVLRERGGDGTVGGDGEVSGVAAAGEIATPGREGPTGGGEGSELNHVPVVIRTGVIAGNASATSDIGRESIDVPGEGGSDGAVGGDGEIGGRNAAGEIATPGREGPASGGHSGELNHVTIMVRARVIAGNGATASNIGVKRVNILGEAGGDRFT